jgi:hypothetical protein
MNFIILVSNLKDLQSTYNWVVLMAILPTDIRIFFTNYDIIAYFLNLSFCSEHFISIKHRILATFNINKKNQF